MTTYYQVFSTGTDCDGMSSDSTTDLKDYMNALLCMMSHSLASDGESYHVRVITEEVDEATSYFADDIYNVQDFQGSEEIELLMESLMRQDLLSKH